MGRDLMGLNLNDAIVIKEDYVQGEAKHSGKGGCGRRTNFPLPITKKAPYSDPFPQFMPVQDDKPSKDYKMHASSMMMSHLVKTRFGTSPNLGGGGPADQQQFLGGGIPLTADPHPILPSAPSFAATSDQWMNPKASPVPAQLTIFYGGAVSVFDDISPDKAEALMFMARNAVIPTPKHPKLAPADWPMALSNFANLPSPLPASSSHTIDHNDDVKASKKLRRSTSSILNKVEPSIVIPSMESAAAAASAMISSAVPQSRKASLARFLEKRKERAMCAMPYNRAAVCGTTPDSNGFGFSATSDVCNT